MQESADEESSSDEGNIIAVSRRFRPAENSPSSAPSGATSEPEVTPELYIDSVPSDEPPEKVENQHISEEETSNQVRPSQNEHMEPRAAPKQIVPPQSEHAPFNNPTLTTAPTNTSQPTNGPLESLQEPHTSCNQNCVTRICREPARLAYYTPGQLLHCQQNFVDASMNRPLSRPYLIPLPPMFWQYDPMPPLVYPSYSVTEVRPVSHVFSLPYLLPAAHPLQVNFPY